MANTKIPKFCEDCRFYRPADTLTSFAKCRSPNAPGDTGGKQFLTRAEFERAAAAGAFADIMREFPHRCGEAAVWFEPKQSDAVAA